jgi:predicted metalloprotease with PDZ domain
MKKFALLLALVMLVVAVPAFAGGDKCTAADANDCLSHWGAMKDKGWSGVELDKSDMSVIKVKAVTPGSPAAKAGLMAGDVLVALNGASLTDKEAVEKAKGEWSVGQSVTYTIKRKNAEKQIAIKLDKIPESVFAAMLGKHMLENHMTMAAATPAEPSTGAAATTTEKTDK